MLSELKPRNIIKKQLFIRYLQVGLSILIFCGKKDTIYETNQAVFFSMLEIFTGLFLYIC